MMNLDPETHSQWNSSADMNPFMVAMASGLMLCAMVGTVISCICCVRPNRHSREGGSPYRDSRRDTIPLEDLLSKPSLADPESVFSEFFFDGRLSDEVAEKSGTFEVSNSTSSSITGNVVYESVDEQERKTSKKSNRHGGGSTSSYRELNNYQEVYKKRSADNGQTLHNNLDATSSKPPHGTHTKIDNDKKINESLGQQEGEGRKEKFINTQQDLSEKARQKTGQKQSKSSLEVLDDNVRLSSGSESVSFSSSARGSLCHDIGTSANIHRQPRGSIFQHDLQSHSGPGRDSDKVTETNGLCKVAETSMAATEEGCSDEEVTVEGCSDEEVTEEEKTLSPTGRGNDDEELCQSPNQFQDTAERTQQTGDENRQRVDGCREIKREMECNNDLLASRRSKRLKTSYSVESPQRDPITRGKIPERISLNLHIDFHFPSSGQVVGEGQLPIVVCSPITVSEESTQKKSNKSEGESYDRKPSVPVNDWRTKEVQKRKLGESQSCPVTQLSRDVNSDKTDVTVRGEPNSSKDPMLHLTPKIPFWVTNRLSEPLDSYKLIKKIESSPNLKRRSFTVADFQSMKCTTFTEVYSDDGPLESVTKDARTKWRVKMEAMKIQPKVMDNIDVLSSNLSTLVSHKDNAKHSAEKMESPVVRNDALENSKNCNGLNTVQTDDKTVRIVVQVPHGESPSSADVSVVDSIKERTTESAYVTPSAKPPLKDASRRQQLPGNDERNADSIDEEHFTDKNANVKQHQEDTSSEICQINVYDEHVMNTERNESTAAPEEYSNTEKIQPNETHESSTSSVNGFGYTGKQCQTQTYTHSEIPTEEVENDEQLIVSVDYKATKYYEKENSPQVCQINVYNEDGIPTEQQESTATPERDSDIEKTKRSETRESSANTGKERTQEIQAISIISSENIENSDGSKLPEKREGSLSSLTDDHWAQTTSSDACHVTSADDMDNDASSRETIDASFQYNTDCRACSDHDSPADSSQQDSNDPCSSLNEIFPSPTRPADTGLNRARSNSSGNIPTAPSHPLAADGKALASQKPNTADNSIDTNYASDDSDYDNPWDSIDNAVKRASMKYHKRPSVADTSVRELMLKSAEDLGRLIEMAEKRRRDRLNSTKSTCHETDSTDASPNPIFQRKSPLRHTVKGVLSRNSTEKLEDGFLSRIGGGGKSVRQSKDDSHHGLISRGASRFTKSLKYHSPETKKRKGF